LATRRSFNAAEAVAAVSISGPFPAMPAKTHGRSVIEAG